MDRRECTVEFPQYIDKEKEEGYFIGIYQYSRVHMAVLRGDVSGQIAYPVAVVEVDGQIKEFNLKNITLLFHD